MDKIGKAEIDALLKMPFDIEIMGRLYYQARELLLSQGFDFYKHTIYAAISFMREFLTQSWMRKVEN